MNTILKVLLFFLVATFIFDLVIDELRIRDLKELRRLDKIEMVCRLKLCERDKTKCQIEEPSPK